MIGVIGGSFDQFVPAVRLYRQAGAHAGHDPARLRVGVHAMGFVADTEQRARDAFFPGWAHMFGEAARERGWSAPTRAQFDSLCSPQGAFLIGDPATAAAKIVAADAAFGGISRITFQMSTAMWEPDAMQRSIELLGSEVAPRLRRALGHADAGPAA